MLVCMFACSGSSLKPSEPVGKIMKTTMQTSLDSYSRPGTRLAKRVAQAKGPREEAQGTRRTLKSNKEAGLNDVVHVKEKEKERDREKVRQKAKESQRGLRDPGSNCHEGLGMAPTVQPPPLEQCDAAEPATTSSLVDTIHKLRDLLFKAMLPRASRAKNVNIPVEDLHLA